MRRLVLLIALSLALTPPASSAFARPDEPRTVRRTETVAALAEVARPASLPGQTEGLQVDATTTYRLEPEAGVVRVTVEARLTNTIPPVRRGNRIETAFFDSFVVAAVGPVADASARSGERTLRTSVDRLAEGVDLVVADLSPNLVHGAPQTVTITYDLPAQPARSDSATRINDAFASFFAVGVGDEGAIDVVIDVPDRFDVEFTALGDRPSDREDGRTIFRFEDLSMDDAFSGVSARDDDRLITRDVRVGDDSFEIQAWPGDEEWASFASDAVERGVPAIQELIGLDLDGEQTLAIAETGTPYQYGYAGWFLVELDRIEIGDELDLQVVLHELSHLWLNSDLFESRWINEGLAETVSGRLTDELGGEARPLVPIDRAGPGAQPLNEWAVPALDENGPAIEEFGYNASAVVVGALVDEIGLDRARAVLAHAADNRIAWTGDPDPEAWHDDTGWRYFYDLVEAVGGARSTRTLFEDHVLAPAEAVELDARDDARDDLDRLAEIGDGWTPPLEARRALAAWDFDEVATVIEAARDALEGRDDLAARVAGTDLRVPDALEDAYESADDVVEYLGMQAEYDDVAAEILHTVDRLDAVDPLGRIGLLGAGVGADVDRAEAAFVDGDLERARTSLTAADDAVDGASVQGLIRLAGVGLVGLLSWVLVRWRRRRSVGPMIETLPPLEIEGHRPSQPKGADHPMRRMTRRVAGLEGPAWDAEARAEVTSLFDRLAPEWHTRSSPQRTAVVRDALERGLPAAGIDPGGTVLEVGSGIGVYSSLLADRFDRVVSAELSFEMLKLAAGEPGEAMQADGAHLPVPDRSVDAVVLVNMFLFPDEVHRVLAESGCVLWVNSSGESTPIHLSPDEVASALPGRWRVVTARAGIGLWAVLRRS